MTVEAEHPEALRKQNEAFAKVINSTGFPLQIGIKRKVQESNTDHQWGIMSMEHPWKHPESGETGYADLILRSRCNTQIMVVECKRMLETEWIFLCPSNTPAQPPSKRYISNTFITQMNNGDVTRFGWEQMQVEPSTYRSEFCGIPKMDNKSTSMLERIGGELVEATEAIAFQEKQIYNNEKLLRAYHPVIITTANLKVCKFSPASINDTGEIAECEFEDVPFLRFHKCLGGQLNEPSKSTNLQEVLKEHERTIYVVNSSHLVGFLSEFEYAFPNGINVATACRGNF